MSDERLIRLENLKRICAAGGLGATDLVSSIGSRYTFWRDLLAGHKSFGEKLARRIEEGLALPRGCLDAANEGGAAVWPFATVSRETYDGLSAWQRGYVEGALLAAVKECHAGVFSEQRPVTLEGEMLAADVAQFDGNDRRVALYRATKAMDEWRIELEQTRHTEAPPPAAAAPSAKPPKRHKKQA